ncbi:hypothetical protein Aduo_009120 [Ancylostoma duodenale]
MFCGGGTCQCLSDFVSIEQHCWPKINPGESGCVDERQCEAVWPEATCSSSGVCECPFATVPSRTRQASEFLLFIAVISFTAVPTRDGMVCVSSMIPPSCPLPEPHGDSPNPATVLANPDSHPLNPDSYMPVLCTSSSTKTRTSNGGDGSTWCVYPDGDKDIFIADIYDCIAHPQIKSELFPEYHESVDGLCCPSRGTCTQFMWDPNTIEGASPNNFRTVEHCESYCRDTCARGAVEFVASADSAIYDETPKSGCLSTRSTCGHDHECVLIGSSQTCCPTRENICSPYGGRKYLSRPPSNFDRGVNIAGSRSMTRYYYDIDRGKCLNFVYHGLGNFNNFNTKQDCEAFCSKLVCPTGTPLRIGEDWQRCETSTDCPSLHSCSSSHHVCCPTPQSICTQPKQPGDCTSSIRRYWYNAATRQCEVFHYTGCQGNDNNFISLVLCQQNCKGIIEEPQCQQGRAHRDQSGKFLHCSAKTKCPSNHVCSYDGRNHGCCPTRAYTCSLSADKGVKCGSGRTYRYHFNAATQSCETFLYEGCDGNGNNFLTAQDCQQYCGVGGCPNGAAPLMEESSNRHVVCSITQRCPSTHECVAVPLNGNVVYRCCPSKVYICSQAPQQGSQCSMVSTTRYYFNLVTRRCTSFQYNGCRGNHNNFAKKEQCENFCSSAGCGAGEIVIKDPGTSRPLHCDNDVRNSCPGTSQCRFNTILSSSVCCGFHATDVCPQDERPFVNAMDETVRECAVNVPGSCPAHFLCRFNAKKNRYYCCAPTSENLCPEGRAVFRAKKTALPQRCFVNSRNECADGFSCQSSVKGVTQGFCCSERNVCKDGAKFLVDDSTKMPKICSSGLFNACPLGYRCHLRKPQSVSGFCCKVNSNTVTEGCPPGEYALTSNEKIVECDPFNSESGCPPSQVAFLKGNNPLVCTSSGNNCPLGYFCQFSDKNKQFQCCGRKAGCPGNSVAFLDLTGSPMQCVMGTGVCPSGYSCQEAKQGKFLCCTEAETADRPKQPVSEEGTTTASATTLPPQTPATAVVLQERTTVTAPKSYCPPDAVMTNGECSAMPKLLKPSTMKLFRKCPDGQKPMVFPSTQQPLMCDVTRACPAGFLCTTRMCCPSAVQRRSVLVSS